MSDTVKLIIEIPKETKQAFDKAESNDLKGGYYDHGGIIGKAIQNGIPLDSVKAEIEKIYQGIDTISHNEYENAVEQGKESAYENVLSILDNIGKAESEE